NKYFARFDEEVPIDYEIKYVGGSSNPYSISKIELKNCNRVTDNQDTYEYYMNGRKVEYSGERVPININISNNSLYISDYSSMNLPDKYSIKYKVGKVGTFLPYQAEYQLPGIYIDGIYYYPDKDERITVYHWLYAIKDWLIALVVLCLTLWYAQREFKSGVKYIEDISNDTGSISKEISYINRSLKSTNIYKTKEEIPWWWRKND
ncbi:MAG: hypothetical protein WBK88_05590, partial [Methanothrix sp.]